MRARASSLAFQRLAGSHATSAAGDTLVAIALAGTLFFSVPDLDDARLKIGLYLLLTMAPFSLLSPLIGPALDRRRGGRRAAIILAGGGRAILALVMASATDTLLLYPAAFGVLVLSRAHAVARAALVPAVLGEGERLVVANARLAKTAVIAGAVAAVPGIVAVEVSGPGAALILAGVAFGMTAVAGLALPRPARKALAADPGAGQLPLRIQRAMVVNAAVRALGGFLLFLLAFGLRRAGVSSAGFGLVLGLSGLGSFLGAAYVPRLRRSGNQERVMAVALLAGGGTALIASRSFGFDLAAVVGAAAGAISSASRLSFDSIVQTEAPEAVRARAFARFETTFQLCWVVGAAIPVAVPLGMQLGLGIVSAGFFGTAVWFLASLGSEGRRRLSD